MFPGGSQSVAGPLISSCMIKPNHFKFDYRFIILEGVYSKLNGTKPCCGDKSNDLTFEDGRNISLLNLDVNR
jgi:hypothetical protein